MRTKRFVRFVHLSRTPRIPFDVNAKIEEKPVVHYETVEERRAAMIAAGWSPTVLAQLEEAMEPKFLRDMREEEERERRGEVVDGEVNGSETSHDDNA
jgi:hypothetical protein